MLLDDHFGKGLLSVLGLVILVIGAGQVLAESTEKGGELTFRKVLECERDLAKPDADATFVVEEAENQPGTYRFINKRNTPVQVLVGKRLPAQGERTGGYHFAYKLGNEYFVMDLELFSGRQTDKPISLGYGAHLLIDWTPARISVHPMMTETTWPRAVIKLKCDKSATKIIQTAPYN